MITQAFKQEYKYLRENKYLPGPRVLQIEITNKCCLNCPQCYKPPVNLLKNMTLDDFKKHVDMAADIGVEEISLLNGSAEAINKSSRDGYKASINAAKKLRNAKVNFGINWVARHDNAFDFENIVELSKELGAQFINVVVNKLTGDLKVSSPLTYDDYQYLISIIKDESDSHFITIQKCFDLLISRAVKMPRSILSGCQAGISVAAITLNNEYMPCLHLMYPEKYSSLFEYWTNSSVLDKLRKKDAINTGYCSGCLYANDCKYCRAMTKGSHDNFNAGLNKCALKES